MSERPILFSGPMVRAILAGTKTQTRRLPKHRPGCAELPAGYSFRRDDRTGEWNAFNGEPHERGTSRAGFTLGRPAYSVGDTLWVRESIRFDQFCPCGCGDARSVFCADDAPTTADAWPWKRKSLPSIHCPRGMSRIDLLVTEVRCERLHQITETDAEAEGIEPGVGAGQIACYCGGFRTLWESLNEKRAPWASNPYVWVIEFDRMIPRAVSGAAAGAR